MVQIIITLHGDRLVAHVMSNQSKLPSFLEEDIISSFNVSQIQLCL